MIQRVQSIYLAISIIISIVFAILPFATFEVNDTLYSIKALGLYYADQSGSGFESPNMSLSVVLLFHLLIGVTTILNFKNRKMQIRLCSLNVVLLLVMTGLIFFSTTEIPSGLLEDTLPEITYGFSALLPILSIVFQVLALLAIKKDEQLIKSMDRIR